MTHRVKRAAQIAAFTIAAASMAGSGCPPTMPGMTTPGRDPLPPTKPTGLPDNGTPRWRKTNLTFFITNFTTKNTQDKQIQQITDAFNRWSAVTPLNFARVMSRQGADFVVGFGAGGHCELYVQNNLTCPTDGAFETTTLAHAYFPVGPNQGQCHMNDAQDWSNDRLLFSTLVHELGHSLGLEHLPDMTAVMFASDNGQTGDLQAPDITAIQRLYGSRDGTVKPAARTKPPSSDAGMNRTAPTTIYTDSDGDGIDDATELYVYGTSSRVKDSDGDGIDDGVEGVLGLDPTNNDTDGDGMSDGEELDGDGNAFLPDSGLTGDVTAFVGKYTGTDSVGSPLQFTVAADGTVEGTLSLTQYGFSEDYELIGRAGGNGRVELVSYDYFFFYAGTINNNMVTNGTFDTEEDFAGTWTAAKTPRLRLPDAGSAPFTIGKNAEGRDVLLPARRPDIANYVKPRS